MTAIAPEVTNLEQIMHDEPPACGVNDVPGKPHCGRHARWRCYLPCGCTSTNMLACDDCKRHIDAMVAEGAYCLSCNASVPSVKWTPL